MRMWRTSGGHPHACEGLWVVGSQLSGALAMVAVLLLPKQLGWQRATHKHQYPAWTSCVSASSSVCAAGTRQNLFTGLARVLRAFLGPTATEWKYLPLCIDVISVCLLCRNPAAAMRIHRARGLTWPPLPHEWAAMSGAARAMLHTVSACVLADPLSEDTLPEWSKGVDSSSTSASCVGSNPTAAVFSL